MINEAKYINLEFVHEDAHEDIRDILREMDVHIDEEGILLYSWDSFMQIMKAAVENSEDDFEKDLLDELNSFEFPSDAQYVNIGY